MKVCSSFILSLFTILILSPINVFACACCAEKGHYSISYSKLKQFELDEIKRINFKTGGLYITASGKEEIKGLSSIGENYQLKSSFQNKTWNIDFTDNNGKKGTLILKMPNKMIDFKADIHDGKDGSAGGPLLYKEWRFKYKVLKGTGIFENGIKGKTKYFLVLQGRGNECTQAEDFTHWRLEVTGKRASYAFYGSFKPEDRTGITEPVKENTNPDSLSVANLTRTGYTGCGCTGITKQGGKKQGIKKPFFLSEWNQNNEKETLFMNINGKDTAFKLQKKGKRPQKEVVGSRFRDEYLANGIRVILDYVTKKLPCDGCEGTDYEVTATIVGRYNGKVITLSGSCGC